MKRDNFFEKMEGLGLALSYGDVRLRTSYSEISPAEASLKSKFSKNVPLNCPIVSSPMDTVTEHAMAIAIAKQGGLGIIHRAFSPEEQAIEVARVKFYLNGLIKKPITVNENDTISSILNRIEENNFSFRSFPVLDNFGRVVGVLTGNDFDFCSDFKLTAGELMSKKIITAEEGISLPEVFSLMREHKKKVLPLKDSEGRLAGMYVYTDVKRIMTGGSPDYNIDKNGNLRVGAAIGIGEEAFQRVDLLVAKGVDVVVIDTAHGDSKAVLDILRQVKIKYANLDVVVGNVSEPESAKKLAFAGADGIKVGQGPGSICTTRMVAGIGYPQVTAVYSCSKAIRGSGIPICADGGIEYSGDITIALAAGAENVMLGKMLSGTKEAPGDVIIRQGVPVKKYRGMGSLGAMKDSKGARERYGRTESEREKMVPEGVEGVVPYKGEVAGIIFQLLGGLRSGMGYLGSASIVELQEKADFYRISGAGLGESHPHGIVITEEAPNYSAR